MKFTHLVEALENPRSPRRWDPEDRLRVDENRAALVGRRGGGGGGACRVHHPLKVTEKRLTLEVMRFPAGDNIAFQSEPQRVLENEKR